MNEFSKCAFGLGRSNGWQVVLVGLKPATGDKFEVLLEAKGKQQMEKLVRELELAKAHSPYE